MGYLIEILCWLFLFAAFGCLVWGAWDKAKQKDRDRRRSVADMYQKDS